MSTDFFEVCPHCLGRKKHFHRANNTVVAHLWFGGIEKGVQVTFPEDRDQDNPKPRVVMQDEIEFGELPDLVTTKRLVREIGQGKR